MSTTVRPTVVKHVVVGEGSVIKNWAWVSEEVKPVVKYSVLREYASFYAWSVVGVVAMVYVAIALTSPTTAQALNAYVGKLATAAMSAVMGGF